MEAPATSRIGLTDDKKRLLLEFAVLMGVYYLPSFLNHFLTHRRISLLLPAPGEMVTNLVSSVGRIAVLIYAVFLVGKTIPAPKLRFDIKFDIPIGVLVFCLFRLMSIVAAVFSVPVPYRLEVAKISFSFMPLGWHRPLWVLVPLTLSVAAAALSQELLMRWYLISRLEQLGTKTWMAVVVSVFLFFCGNIRLDPLGVGLTLLTGLIYSLCFVFTRRVWPGAIANFLMYLLVSLEMGGIR